MNSPAANAAPLHILVLDPLLRGPDRPGSTRTYDIAQRLAQSGHRVTVLTTTAAHAENTAAANVTVKAIAAPTRARFGFPAPLESLSAFTRALWWRIWGVAEVDAVVVVDRPVAALPPVVLFCALRGVPLILEAREGTPVIPGVGTPLGRRISAWTARLVFRAGAGFARHVVALSRPVAEALTVSTAKVVVSAPGCDIALLAGADAAPIMSAHPQLGNDAVLVYAGALDVKIEPMLERMAVLVQMLPAVNLILCGDGPARARLEARALTLGLLNKSVIFLDPVARQNLAPLLAAATAVIATGPSAHFYDALAAERPVIVTADGPERELVESRGAGIGLPANDIGAAAREIAEFIQDADGLRRARQQAAALAAGRFSIERVAGEVRAIIEEAVAAEPRAIVMRRRMLVTKRLFDILVSLVALVVLSPVFLVIAAAVAFRMGWPIFFTQQRPGLKGKLFRIVKFRTMAVGDASTAATDAQRLTPLGRFLRRTSLDEMPELINVLFGQMSLVGPRPLLPEYLPYYTPEQRRRHELRPGMTGWAQVNGRNAVSWEERFALDVWYIDNVSLWLDLKILFKTFWVIVAGEGVSAPGHATMPRFDEIMARSQGAEDV